MEIVLEDGSWVRGTFDGFTYRAARVVVDTKLGAESFAFNRMRWLRAGDLEPWTGDELARLDVAGEIPTREAIRLGILQPFSWSRRSSAGITDSGLESSDYAEQVVLPVDRVAAILVRGRSSAPLVLGLMGLVVDILVVRSLNEELDSSKCGPSGPAPTLSHVERSEYEFLPAAGEFGLPALAAVEPDSASATLDR